MNIDFRIMSLVDVRKVDYAYDDYDMTYDMTTLRMWQLVDTEKDW